MARIAVSSDKFALVSDEDWGHAYYQGDWEFVSGVVRLTRKKEATLARYVADRMGLDRTISVAHRNDNPLDCRRVNLYSTPYVWKKGVVIHHMLDGDGHKRTLEADGRLFGNIGLVQIRGHWTAVHQPSGLSLGASWGAIRDAKEGVELLHAELGLDQLDRLDALTREQSRAWRETIHKRS